MLNKSTQKLVYSKSYPVGVYVETINKHGKRFIVTMFTNQTINGHHPVIKIPIEDIIRVEYEPNWIRKVIKSFYEWIKRTFSKPMYK